MITQQRTGVAFGDDGIIVDSYDWKCLSTDEKPTEGVAENDLLTELDTGDRYYFSGTEWAKFGGSNASA